MNNEIITVVLLYTILVMSLVLAVIDVAIAVATLTMIKGLHVMYTQLRQSQIEQENLLQYTIRVWQAPK